MMLTYEILLNALISSLDDCIDNHIPSNTCLDWDEMFITLLNQCIFPIGFQLFKPWMPNNVRKKWTIENALLIKKTYNDITNTLKLISILGDRHDYCIAKGFVLSQILYKTPFLRQFTDVDIYVKEESIINVSNILNDAGYCFFQVDQAMNYADIDIRKYYSKLVETICHSPDKPATIFELKKRDGSSCLFPEIVNKAVREMVYLDLFGKKIPSFNEKYAVWYLIMNAYKNYTTGWCCLNQRPLRDLYDIAFWIKRNPFYDYRILYSAAMESDSAECISYMLSLSCVVFKIPYPCRAELLFPAVELDADTILEEIFDRKLRVNNYANRITEMIPDYAISRMQYGKLIQLKHKIRMPIKQLSPLVFAAFTDEELMLYVLGLPATIDFEVTLKMWDESKKRAPFPYANVQFYICSSNIINWMSDINKSYAHIRNNMLKIRIPLSDSMWKRRNDDRCLLFEFYVSLPQIRDCLVSCLSVGLEGVPYMLLEYHS